MLRAMVAKIGASPTAEQNAIRTKETRPANLARLRPARGPVGRDLLRLAGAPDRHCDRHREGSDTASTRNEAASDEDLVGVGVVGKPPPEEGRRLIDRPAEEHEPGTAKLRLEGELPSCPLCCRPDKDEDGSADEKDLDPENLGRVHGDQRPSERCQRGTQAQTEGPWGPDTMAEESDAALRRSPFEEIGIRALRPGYSALTSVAR